MNLPAIPNPGTSITLIDVIAIEASIAQQIAVIDDFELLDEMRRKADALAQWLRGKELHGPMLGAQRRIEARIGQLLGETKSGERHDLRPSHVSEGLSKEDRQRFRLLARGFDVGLREEDWRKSRRSLITYLQEKYPVPRRLPDEVVTTDGKVKKCRDERVREIQTLVDEGFRAVQIADALGLGEEQVRKLSKVANITLPDAAMGRAARPDSKRILSETINGVDAYVSGLPMLDDIGLPELEHHEQVDLMQALARAINGLRKLRIKMEKQYAGSSATAA